VVAVAVALHAVLGCYTAGRIVENDPNLRAIPVVVLTTSRSEKDIAASYALGCSSYITKPRDFSELVDVMRSFSQYWLDTVTLPSPTQ